MQQPATKNIFTRPLPSLPSLSDQSDHKEPDYAVTRTALLISGSTFFHGIFYLAALGFIESTPAIRQSVGIAGLVFLLIGVFGFILSSGLFKEDYVKRMAVLSIAIQVSLMIAALTTYDLAVAGALSLLSFLLIGNYFFSDQKTVIFVVIGLISGFITVLIDLFSPLAQIDDGIFGMYWGLIFLAEFIVVIYFIATGRMARYLQMKIFFISITIALVPIAAIVLFNYSFQRNSTIEANRNFTSLAAEKQADVINNFIASNLNNLSQQAKLEIFTEFLELPELKRNASAERAELDETVSILTQSSQQLFLKSYGVLDKNGTVVYDSYSPAIGANEAEENYFKYSFNFRQPFFSSVRFLIYPYDAAEIIFSAPIVDASDEVIGAVRIRYNADVFQNLLRQQIVASGDKSYAILIDENGLRLADNSNREAVFDPVAPLPEYAITTLQIENRVPNSFRPNEAIYNPAIEKAIKNYKFDQYFEDDVITDNELKSEIGYLARIDKMPWFLVYVQEQIIANQRAEQQANTTTLVIATFIALTGFLSLGIARVISAPILKLTDAASQVSKGNLEVNAQVRSKDEIGTLAVVFNSMTRRLRTIITELEDRVSARTKELDEQNKSLAHRSQQLTTIADVARSVIAENDLETLLSQVTNLISERFDFYHVGIFLVDPAGQYAVLRAANSEGGQRMLARQHKLRVGQVGIVGYATGTGQARIATDVGEEAIYFNNPDLPRTRSEMALPLKDGEKVIGALDVQSMKSNAFSTEDIELFNTLSDQVAVAIVNSRLYEETQQALREMQEINRQYLRQSWSEKLDETEQLSYRYSLEGISTTDPLSIEDVKPVVESNSPIVPESRTLQLPITLRGETIGVIQIQKPDQAGEWDSSQISTIERVSDQIALALESARLFEETAKRAERDRKVLEITSKIRSTTDFNEMLEIAVNELKRELNASGAQVVLQQNVSLKDQDEPDNDNGHHL
jgi:GAF domain-containing protein/HAMP domain-containing protein